MASWSLLLFLQGEFLTFPGCLWLLYHRLARNLPLFNVHSFAWSLVWSARKQQVALSHGEVHRPHCSPERRPHHFQCKAERPRHHLHLHHQLWGQVSRRHLSWPLSLLNVSPFSSHINLIFSFQAIILICKFIFICCNTWLPCYSVCSVCSYTTSQCVVQWLIDAQYLLKWCEMSSGLKDGIHQVKSWPCLLIAE